MPCPSCLILIVTLRRSFLLHFATFPINLPHLSLSMQLHLWLMMLKLLRSNSFAARLHQVGAAIVSQKSLLKSSARNEVNISLSISLSLSQYNTLYSAGKAGAGPSWFNVWPFEASPSPAQFSTHAQSPAFPFASRVFTSQVFNFNSNITSKAVMVGEQH